MHKQPFLKITFVRTIALKLLISTDENKSLDFSCLLLHQHMDCTYSWPLVASETHILTDNCSINYFDWSPEWSLYSWKTIWHRYWITYTLCFALSLLSIPNITPDIQLVQNAFRDFDNKRFSESETEFTLAINRWKQLNRPRDELVSLLKVCIASIKSKN